MRSLLTRNVFRRLLSNEGLIIRCPTQSSLQHNIHRRHGQPPIVRAPTRRTLFGFSRKAAREPKEAHFAPGLSAMVQLSVRQEQQAQLPPRKGLIKAWIDFFEYKSANKEAVNNVEAEHALRTYKYLRTGQDRERMLSLQELKTALDTLHRKPKDDMAPHVELARLLYADCSGSGSEKYLRSLVAVLTRTGNTSEAKKLVWSHQTQSKEETTAKALLDNFRQRGIWTQIAIGFASEDNEVELLKTLELVEDSECGYNSTFQEIIVSYYASKSNVAATKQWYEQPLADPNSLPTANTLKEILNFSIRNGELDWCKAKLREVLAMEPPKATWDVILQWAAGALGKGVEDVEKMMELMMTRSSGDNAIKPDAETVNGLVELAMSVNDPYLAERYIALGLKFGIRPNAKTYSLQMSYRIDANDLRGAQASYESLQAEEASNDVDLPAINKYIRALCSAKNLDYDRIVFITSDFSEREKRLEAETVCALTKLYLSRDETTELIDLINSESYHYTFEERANIREVFMNFCLSPNTSTIRSWGGYQLLHPLFDETNVAERTLLMNDFFKRGRCDMASYVFGHMRAHNLPDRRPVLDTYIQCFLGIASCADREALDMVHNMLKMDSSIDPNTRLYNSLILAYTACEDANRAISFWDDITNSDEGPSYRSLEIVFYACSRKPFGDNMAREIWSKMRKMDIEVTGKVFSAYVGALAGQGKLEEAKEVCEKVPKELGLSVDVLTLGTFYNAIPGQNRKDLVEEWAIDLYPEAWKELEELGRTEHEEGHLLFNMAREFKA